MNQKKMMVLFLVLGLALAPVAQVYAGSQYKHPHGTWRQILGQLPEEKGDLFLATMKDAREKAAPVREEIQRTRADLREMLAAPEFDESLFKEKARRVRELRNNERQIMEEAVIHLAKQFTPEERKILAKLISKPNPHRRQAH